MIFISYRISDALDVVGRLDADLTREFGPELVFCDKTRLEAGKNWTDQLTGNARSRRVMLVVIGATWQSAVFADGDQKGFPRLSDPEDWVRKEITLSLESGRAVLPVFLNGASMPSAKWLARCGLEPLHEKQGLPLRTVDYDADYVRLITELRRLCPELPRKRPDDGPAKRWTPDVVYPLQPAPHFAGREALLKDLSTWATASDDPNRVVALVAAGGTGKTALAERVLASLAGYAAAGVFVWSFYENPQTEAFLRAACEYFLGEAPKETGGLLERLQLGLRADNLPHLLILDGLELVQATGTTGRPRGELEDPLIKRFLRWLAAGQGTRGKALITSRFQLLDLAGWTDRGFRPIDLGDLDFPAARAVLRKWDVKGTDENLDTLSGRVHCHALTVDVLGSYLGTFHGGDTTKAPSFDPQFWADTDPKTAKLQRVLTSYAEKLLPRERDLLARLSIFPRGVGVDVIGYLIDAGGEVAATLTGCGQDEVLKLLERLRGLGLVFRYDVNAIATFTAHPFLRGFFEKLIGIKDAREIHEAVRSKLAVGLEERPNKHPADPASLDRYERLIEITRLAGETKKAFNLYWFGMGNYSHLGIVLGDDARGLRIVSGFSADNTLATAGHTLSDRQRALLVTCWGLFAKDLGDLTTARHAFKIHNDIQKVRSDAKWQSFGSQNVAEVELLAGRWPAALEAAEMAFEYAKHATDERELTKSPAYCAAARTGLGFVSEARQQFAIATRHQNDHILYSRSGLWEAELKLATGDKPAAAFQNDANRTICRDTKWTDELALCETLSGHCVLPNDTTRAKGHLRTARAYAARSGHIEVTLRCYHLAAEIAQYERNYALAISEALDGIQLADSCGFGRWSLDIRTELATTYLAAGNPTAAIEPAEWVLKRSQEPDCQYAWGIADSLHLLGVAHARLGDTAKARAYLRRASEKRKPLEHPGLKDTEAELRRLEGK